MALFPFSPSSPVWPPGPPSGLTGWGLLRQMAADLPAALAGWRETYGDVFHLRIWPEHQVVLADPELARSVLIRHHDGLTRWEHGLRVFARIHGGSVLVAEGEDWQRQRRALQPLFSPQAVAAFQGELAAVAAETLDRWQPGPARPVEEDLTALTMAVILRRLASAGGGDAAAVTAALFTLSRQMDADFYRPLSTFLPVGRQQRQALAVLHGMIDRHVAARLAVPPSQRPADLLTHLLTLHGQDPQGWPLHWVRDEAVTAFLAGFETTAATLTWWAWCMASHPQEQERARAEVMTVLGGRAPTAEALGRLPGLTRSVQEALRLYPPAPVLFSRRTAAPLDLGRWRIPARTLLMIPVMLIQRDPRWFPDPGAFRPDRFAPGAAEIPRGAWMPFGAGPRVCLGQGLAMAEAVTVAALLLQRFRLAVSPQAPAVRPVMRVTVRPERFLRLDLQPV